MTIALAPPAIDAVPPTAPPHILPLVSSSTALPSLLPPLSPPLLPLLLRVTRVADIASDIRLFELISADGADGAALPPAAPGAHLRLQLPAGMTRSYSLCHTPGQPGYQIAVKREPASRGGSAWLHAQLRVGDVLQASAPVDAFPLETTGATPALFAAGIGITPLYTMAAALSARDQPFHLHYFARSLRHAAFASELDSLCGRHGLALHLGLDGDASARAIRSALHGLDRHTPLYVCGPHPFIETVRSSAAARGWRAADVHVELFAAPDTAATSAPLTTEAAFELVLQRSGVRCTVAPGQSIVAAAAEVGVAIGTSCGEGFCGSCETAVLDGQPLHRDSVLGVRERAAGKTILPCVSRCAGPRLVLDL